MNYTELKEKTDQFIATLPDLPLAPDRELGKSLLNGFLWWLYPQMSDEELPDYGVLVQLAPHLTHQTGAQVDDDRFVTCPRCG